MLTLWVGIGGAVGSIARYQLGRVAAARAPGFPWGTLFINVLGSLLLAVLMALVLRGRVSDSVRIALGTGLLGGFTTYSSFNYETLALVQQGAYARAAIYVLATVVGCFAAGLLGWILGKHI